MAHIIVVGNEKGGAGKSTVSMHVATALARMGHSISALDLDLRQKTFGRYAENRRRFMAKAGLDLPGPDYHDLDDWKFAQMAAPMGGKGVRVTTRKELVTALEAAQNDTSCFQLIEIMLERGQISQTLNRFVNAVKRLSATK